MTEVTRHRWAPIDDAAVRHKGRCVHCGLVRTRAPGTRTTEYFRVIEARLTSIGRDVKTPPCAGEEGEG